MSLAVVIAAVLLAAYVLVGALDLGVGLLLPLLARGRDRDVVLAGGGHPWSAGAVWTLLAFALLVAGLPGSFQALRALWPALVLMLLALAARGALVAMRAHVLRRDLVDLAFGLASLLAAACQGFALGWALGGLGADLPARHAGPFGTVSVWGLLCAAGAVGLHALIGSGWLILSGRDAVRVFGREVGRAAAILFAASAVLCAAWAVWPTGVAARAFAGGWASGIASTLPALGSLALLVPFGLSLWGRRPGLPLACAALAAACGFAAVAALGSASAEAWSGLSLSAAYLAFVLLVGSPLALFDLRRRLSALGRRKVGAPGEAPSHAGRRVGSLANSLHLS